VTEADASEEPQIEMMKMPWNFTEQVAKDIMVPRTELVAIPPQRLFL
jgi:CBS domain containing-hemolysin-like protein